MTLEQQLLDICARFGATTRIAVKPKQSQPPANKACPACGWPLAYENGHCGECGWNDALQVRIVTLAGRCANGAERDHGTRQHAVPLLAREAVCGAKPGRRSVGWSSYHISKAVTCPRCIKALESSKRRAEGEP